MKMGKLRFIICVWFLFMYGSCLCNYVVENNSLKVSSPENVKGTYQCAVSSFDVPQHGGTLTGIVVYPNVNQNACDSFANEFSFKTKSHAGSLPVLLLVDRGDCSFIRKARNAQNGGAAGILVANDNEFLTAMHFPEVAEGYNTLNLTIPSALISKSLGDSLKKALYEDEFVRVNLEWAETFTHMDANTLEIVGECESDNCDDESQEHESDYYWPSHYMWRFMIMSSPVWGFRMMNIESWLVFLWENGIIGSVFKLYKL